LVLYILGLLQVFGAILFLAINGTLIYIVIPVVATTSTPE
jgi:hypothetical protein